MADVITKAELASFLQVPDVDNASADIAIADAQAAVRRYTRQEFTTQTWTDVSLPVTLDRVCGRVIELPQRPIVSVAAVAVNGVALSPSAFAIDQLRNRIAISAYMPPLHAGLSDQALVTYTSGTAIAPSDVIAAVRAVAARLYSNPTAVTKSVITVGQYSEGEDRSSVQLLPDEMAMLADYRRTVGSTRIR